VNVWWAPNKCQKFLPRHTVPWPFFHFSRPNPPPLLPFPLIALSPPTSCDSRVPPHASLPVSELPPPRPTAPPRRPPLTPAHAPESAVARLNVPLQCWPGIPSRSTAVSPPPSRSPALNVGALPSFLKFYIKFE
jgi:hypothetical protein